MKQPVEVQLFPRLNEIIKDNRFQTSANHFDNFDVELDRCLLKKSFFESIEKIFQQIEEQQWEIFKEKLVCCGYNHPRRGLNQFFETCNEAEAFAYIQKLGGKNVRFIPEASLKSPDIFSEIGGRDVYCEVKTVNISDDHADRNAYLAIVGQLDAVYDTHLSYAQKIKIVENITSAHAKIDNYDVKNDVIRFLYLIINAENPLAPMIDDRLNELKQFINSISFRPLNIFIKLKPFGVSYCHFADQLPTLDQENE